MLGLEQQIILWNYASIRVMDVRLIRLETGETVRMNALPANAFICVSRGTALCRLDGAAYRMEPFHILHGAQGATLHIDAEEAFHYWLVLYKASLMLPRAWRWLGLAPSERPLQENYCFVPSRPVLLHTRIKNMHEDWSRREPLLVFRAKAQFYQFVYELLSQMKECQEAQPRPDLLSQAVRFMEEHYREPVSLDGMAAALGVSVSRLTKLFKKRLQTSPMRHLAHIRLEGAAELLFQTPARLQDIAEQVGYPDAQTLSRAFKKRYGYSPAQLRSAEGKEMAQMLDMAELVPKLPGLRTKNAILPDSSRCYSVVDENDSHYRQYGGISLYKTKYSMSLSLSALLLSFSLLLGACGGAASPGSGASATATASPGAAATAPTSGSAAQMASPAKDAQVSAAGTRIYTNSLGTVTVPAEPKRIVDLTGSAIGNLLQLGMKPIATVDYALINPYHAGKLDGIKDIGDGSNPETLLSLDPDLIITFDYVGEEAYKKLTQIAPTVRLKYGGQSPSELLMEYGKMLGKEKQAEEWIASWRSKIDTVKPDILKVAGDKVVSIIQPHDKGVYAWGNKGGRGGEILYDEFGLKAPPLVKKELIEGELAGKDISIELLPQYAGDYIFTSEFGWDERKSTSEFYNSTIWKNLDAVKNGHSFFIDPIGFYYNDPISLEKQLDFITSSLLGSPKPGAGAN